MKINPMVCKYRTRKIILKIAFSYMMYQWNVSFFLIKPSSGFICVEKKRTWPVWQNEHVFACQAK